MFYPTLPSSEDMAEHMAPSCSHQDMKCGILITEDRAWFCHSGFEMQWCEEGQCSSVTCACACTFSMFAFFWDSSLCRHVLLLLDHQPQVPALFCFWKRGKYVLFAFGQGWSFSMFFILHFASWNKHQFCGFPRTHMVRQLCGLEMITGQTSLPPQPNTDASKGVS